ncbi:hypothetical protein ACFLRM_02855 [Acidobacteriota bacterium]
MDTYESKKRNRTFDWVLPRYISILASPIPPWGIPSAAGGGLHAIHSFR